MIAAITAGGRVDGELAAAIGTTIKALAPCGDTTPLELAIAAARAAGAERVVVIGGAEVRARVGMLVDDVIAESTEGRDNITHAIVAAGDRPLLLLASDMPFLRNPAVIAFVAAAQGADLALPLAESDAYETAFPGAPPHITRLGRERVANGSIVYFAPGVAPRVHEIALRLFDARKDLLRMATLLGPALLLRFATGRLRIADVEARATQVFGIRARAIRGCDPGLCFDIDDARDYHYAVKRLAQTD